MTLKTGKITLLQEFSEAFSVFSKNTYILLKHNYTVISINVAGGVYMNKFQTKKDVLLMTYFRNNARENLTRISKMTSIPVSTIFDKLREYEKDIIKKHTTLVDFKKMGFDIKINILFKIGRDSREEFKQFLVTNENINSVFKVNNGFDFLVEAIFKDMNSMQRFTESIEKFQIEDKQEMFILEDIKREGFLADRMHAELLFAER
jgi:DNA-binding Lrp family transcriptional regulator